MTEDVKIRMSKNSISLWSDYEFKNKMINKMKEVNQQEEKRKVSSEKNKEYWKLVLEKRRKTYEAKKNRGN